MATRRGRRGKRLEGFVDCIQHASTVDDAAARLHARCVIYQIGRLSSKEVLLEQRVDGVTTGRLVSGLEQLSGKGAPQIMGLEIFYPNQTH